MQNLHKIPKERTPIFLTDDQKLGIVYLHMVGYRWFKRSRYQNGVGPDRILFDCSTRSDGRNPYRSLDVANYSVYTGPENLHLFNYDWITE